jgi:mutator protein MutT
MEKIYFISEAVVTKLDPDIPRVPVAGAIIFKNLDSTKGQLLLIQRAKDDHYPNHWEFPRGKVDDGEKIKDGLLREVKEEVGLDINILKYFNKFSYVVKESGIIKRVSTQYNWICTPKDINQEVKLSFEHQAYKWISHDAEAELYLYNEIKQTVMAALTEYGNFVLNTGYADPQKNIKVFEQEDYFMGTNF